MKCMIILIGVLLLACSGCGRDIKDKDNGKAENNVAATPAGDERDAEIKQLIVELGDCDYAKRQSAQANLERIGKEAVPYLMRALNDPDIEIRFRALDILQSLDRAGVVDLDKIWDITNPTYYLDKGLKLSIGSVDGQAKANEYLLKYIEMTKDVEGREEVLSLLADTSQHLWAMDRWKAGRKLAEFVLNKSSEGLTRFLAAYVIARIDNEYGDTLTAIESLKRALELSEGMTTTLIRSRVIRVRNILISIYKKNGDGKGIEEQYAAIQNAYKRWGMDAHSSAMALLQAIAKGDEKTADKTYQDVVTELDAATHIDLDVFGEVLLNYGTFLQERKKISDAVGVYRKLVEISFPYSPELYEESARCIKSIDPKLPSGIPDCGVIIQIQDKDGKPIVGFNYSPSFAITRSGWSMGHVTRCVSDSNGIIKVKVPSGTHRINGHVIGAGQTAKLREKFAVITNFPKEFKVVEGEFLRLPPVKLMPYLKITSPKEGELLASGNVELTWEKYPEAAEYKVIISRQTGQIYSGVFLEKKKTSDTTITLRQENGTPLSGGGIYVLYLFAYDKDGKKISESKELKFVVENR